MRITTDGERVGEAQSPFAWATTGWFIALMCLIALLLLICIIACICKRKKGVSTTDSSTIRVKLIIFPFQIYHVLIPNLSFSHSKLFLLPIPNLSFFYSKFIVFFIPNLSFSHSKLFLLPIPNLSFFYSKFIIFFIPNLSFSHSKLFLLPIPNLSFFYSKFIIFSIPNLSFLFIPNYFSLLNFQGKYAVNEGDRGKRPASYDYEKAPTIPQGLGSTNNAPKVRPSDGTINGDENASIISREGNNRAGASCFGQLGCMDNSLDCWIH